MNIRSPANKLVPNPADDKSFGLTDEEYGKKIKKRIKKITSLKKSQSIPATSIPIGVNAFFMKQQS
ncbi:MAG: hypothetical protein M3264_12130 [Thermoproteota archaeon]|nr:hypothetical protein [Thermoproteota archaeon]